MRIRGSVALLAPLTLVLWGAGPAHAAKPPPKSFSISPVTQSLGEGAANAQITVSRSVKSGSASVGLSTHNGSAVFNHDYFAVNTIVTFSSGQLTRVVNVPLLNDAVSEATESFTASLALPSRGYVLPSNVATVTITDTDAPAAPANVVATALSLDGIGLTWDAPADQVDYWSAVRSKTAGGPYDDGVTTGTTPGFEDSGLDENTTYYYVVSTVHGAAATPAAEVSATTGEQVLAPDVTATSTGQHGIDLDWSVGPSDPAADWSVGRATVSGGPYTVVDAETAGSFFFDSGLDPGTTYYYVVTAYNAFSTAASDEVSETTDPIPPVLLPDDIEGGLTQWRASGLWHSVENDSCVSPLGYTSPTQAWRFGRDSGCGYATGQRETGTLTSPNYSGVAGATSFSFNYALETEPFSVGGDCGNGYDLSVFDLSYDGGATWTIPAGGVCLADSLTWTTATFPIAPTGDTLRVRFYFDTKDEQFNGFLGWFIDDLSVTSGT